MIIKEEILSFSKKRMGNKKMICEVNSLMAAKAVVLVGAPDLQNRVAVLVLTQNLFIFSWCVAKT